MHYAKGAQTGRPSCFAFAGIWHDDLRATAVAKGSELAERAGDVLFQPHQLGVRRIRR
jgi:hypothetical protein